MTSTSSDKMVQALTTQGAIALCKCLAAEAKASAGSSAGQDAGAEASGKKRKVSGCEVSKTVMAACKHMWM